MRTFKSIERVWDYLPAWKRHQVFMMVFYYSNATHIKRIVLMLIISGVVCAIAGGQLLGLLLGLLSGTYAAILIPIGGVKKVTE